ncbi:MAG: hypothetical protein PVH40_01310 [Gemmatimonadales bacterium]|jgi:hypothetical protein
MTRSVFARALLLGLAVLIAVTVAVACLTQSALVASTDQVIPLGPYELRVSVSVGLERVTQGAVSAGASGSAEVAP